MSIMLTARLLQRSCCIGEISVMKRSLTGLKHINKHPELRPVFNTKYFSTDKDYSKTSDAPKSDLLIYQGDLASKVLWLRVFSMTTSVGGLLIQPTLMKVAIEENNMFGVVGIAVVFGIFTVGTPILTHLLAKRYVTKVYYNEKENEYTAHTYSFFLRNKKLKFQPTDVKPLEVTGMFSNCQINETPLFLNQQDFTDPKHYDNIFGYEYDKVFPFKLEDAEALKQDTLDNENNIKINSETKPKNKEH